MFLLCIATDALCLCHRWDFVDVGVESLWAIGRWVNRHQGQPCASDNHTLQYSFCDCTGRPAFCRIMSRCVCAMEGLMVQVCAAPGRAVP